MNMDVNDQQKYRVMFLTLGVCEALSFIRNLNLNQLCLAWVVLLEQSYSLYKVVQNENEETDGLPSACCVCQDP